MDFLFTKMFKKGVFFVQVHCDRELLRSEMPRVYAHVSHRVVDTSSVLHGMIEPWCPMLKRSHSAWQNSIQAGGLSAVGWEHGHGSSSSSSAKHNVNAEISSTCNQISQALPTSPNDPPPVSRIHNYFLKSRPETLLIPVFLSIKNGINFEKSKFLSTNKKKKVVFFKGNVTYKGK